MLIYDKILLLSVMEKFYELEDFLMENTRKVKPWDEMSDKEKASTRKSWRRKLPEKFDVFCLGDLETPAVNDYQVPGDLYVRGNLRSADVIVGENLFVEGDVNAFAVKVKKDFYVGGRIDSFGINVGDDFILANRAQFWNEDVVVGGDFICGSTLRCGDLSTGGDIRIDGEAKAITIQTCGDLEIHGDLSCGTLNVQGSFIVDGFIKTYAQYSSYSIGRPFLCES